ncbi:hypothetical protein FRC00_003280 [Tulasnella sp. 408]|nr:hypothetical protein FRC00_003280 [Tulasnella sp. 408]
MKAKFMCDICGKGLASMANVRRHIDSMSKRKDLVKQHLGNTHPNSGELEVLTLYWTSSSSSSQSSTAGDLTPPPALPVDVTSAIHHLQPDHAMPSPIEYPSNWMGDLTAPPPPPTDVFDSIPPLQLDPAIPSAIQFSLNSQTPILQQYVPTDQSAVPQYWSTHQAVIPHYWPTNQSVTPQHWPANQSVTPQQWSADQSVTALTALWGDHLHL